MNHDILFMQRALELARKAQGFTYPNPMVGAVIVKNKKIIAEGFHHQAGSFHAEFIALKQAQNRAQGATLYLNLEPCNHFGKTPPCVDKIITAGIKRVVVATIDPNPLMRGKSLKKLKQAGIKITLGVGAQEARKLNEVFFKNMHKQLPFVAAKCAQSLDGKIATHTGESKWITSLAARNYSRHLRDRYDSVLVGINTVVNDDPQLNGINKTPFKIVIDPHLKIALTSKLIKHYNKKLIIVASQKKSVRKTKLPLALNVIFVKEKNNRLDLRDMLVKLYSLGVCSVFVEGGSNTLGGFFDAGLVDKMYFFIAPKIIGGKQALTSIGGTGAVSPYKSFYLQDRELEFVGEDLLISGYPLKLRP